MSPEDLEKYLYENIPLSKAMGISVVSLSSNKVTLKSLLQPNINHKKTAFGGSLNAVATLACWSLLYVNLLAKKQKYEIVITQSQIAFSKSVQADFEATSVMCSEKEWNRFMAALERKGKGRITLEAFIGQIDKPSVSFRGTFAALAVEPSIFPF